MEKEQLEKRKVITVKGTASQAYFELLEQVQEAVLEGYVIPPADRRWTKDRPIMVGRNLMVVMYPKGYEVPKPGKNPRQGEIQEKYLKAAREEEERNKKLSENSDKIKEDLEGLSKKDELLEYAKSIGLEVPEDKVQPKAIKAFILKSVK